ncbi:NfeD family protein [candidate division CSSED10-310 bacterium]|uniref:NfeD family protein n=1 Tax=candidate division CSSED10-310 bacterium TaxID=2855610 RepID=A0ABV6YRM6_UNCC1
MVDISLGQIFFWLFLSLVAIFSGRFIIALVSYLLEKQIDEGHKPKVGKARYLNQIAAVRGEFKKEQHSDVWTGIVMIKGERWSAILKSQPEVSLTSIQQVTVIGMNGLTLEVVPLPDLANNNT